MRTSKITRAVGLVAAVLAVAVVPVEPASAAVSVSSSLTVPAAVTVGEHLSGSVTVVNTNTVPNQAESNTLTQVLVTPSCGTTGAAANPCPTPDPGVFSVLSASGATGTACAGVVFTSGTPDASGSIVLTPTSPVSLAPPGGTAGSDRCTVNFTLLTLKVPAIDSNPGAPGVQTRFSGRGQATSAVSGLTVTTFLSVEVTVAKATPAFGTHVSSSSASLGGIFRDSAGVTAVPVSSRTAPTGTVHFQVFGPDDPDCTRPPFGQSTNPLRATGPNFPRSASADSDWFTATEPGVYRFVATYSGDANFNPVTSPCNAPNESVLVSPVADRPRVDFDGNGSDDIAVFRPSNGVWYLRTASPTAIFWGQNGDIPVPGDYDGNRITDLAVFRPANNTWYLQTSPMDVVWGAPGDIPVPGDYDGNGTTDIAVFRPSNGAWYLRTASPTAIVWGQNGDIPVPGDYDGNGTRDLAVYRPGNNTWYLRTATPTAVVWGAPGDVPVPGRYDANTSTDIAVFRPSNGAWYLRTASPTAIVWGQSGDIPQPGDYDNNGVTDLAVFRPANSAWYVRTASPFVVVWGTTGDQPLLLPDAIRRFFF